MDDANRQPFADAPFRERADRLAGIVRRELSACPDEAERLIDALKRQTQPPCMHRFTRYLDIQLTSIGALRWRGSLPPDAAPKAAWQAFLDQALAALRRWAEDMPLKARDTETARRIYAVLGEPAEIKQAIVRDFALEEFWDVGASAAWEWLVCSAQTTGTNAYSVFHLNTFDRDHSRKANNDHT
jgi:hypothetical protein